MNTSYYFSRVARLQIVACFVLIWRAKLCKEVLSTDVRIQIIIHMILMCWVILFNTFKICNKFINNLSVHIHTDVCHFLNAYLSCQLPCQETIIDTEEVNVWSRLVQGVELDCWRGLISQLILLGRGGRGDNVVTSALFLQAYSNPRLKTLHSYLALFETS